MLQPRPSPADPPGRGFFFRQHEARFVFSVKIGGENPRRGRGRRKAGGSDLDQKTVKSLLDAMEGVTYLLDPEAVIVAVGERGWRSFAELNGAPDLAAAASVLGRSLLDLVQGQEVRQSYEGFLTALRRETCRSLSFEFSCDAPAMARRMRMSISVVAEGDRLVGFLFQSLLLEERSRPPVSLFDPEVITGMLASRKGWPILRLCSYCQRVKAESDTTEWIPAELYYQRGGTSQVRVSHGICPTCMREVVEPLLD